MIFFYKQLRRKRHRILKALGLKPSETKSFDYPALKKADNPLSKAET